MDSKMPTGRHVTGGGLRGGCSIRAAGGVIGCGDASTPRAWWLRGVVLVGMLVGLLSGQLALSSGGGVPWRMGSTVVWPCWKYQVLAFLKRPGFHGGSRVPWVRLSAVRVSDDHHVDGVLPGRGRSAGRRSAGRGGRGRHGDGRRGRRCGDLGLTGRLGPPSDTEQHDRKAGGNPEQRISTSSREHSLLDIHSARGGVPASVRRVSDTRRTVSTGGRVDGRRCRR